MKSEVYDHNRPDTLEELRAKIVRVVQGITPDMLANVRQSFYDRLTHCSAQAGGLFEHFL